MCLCRVIVISKVRAVALKKGLLPGDMGKEAMAFECRLFWK